MGVPYEVEEERSYHDQISLVGGLEFSQMVVRGDFCKILPWSIASGKGELRQQAGVFPVIRMSRGWAAGFPGGN